MFGLKTATTEFMQELENNPNVDTKAFKAGCCSVEEWYMLKQAFALVRHADRLDHWEELWQHHPEREAFPNDTPLTDEGHKHAHDVGDVLKNTGRPWKIIISSPYYRCAQTASRIAEKLGIPVHFDLDLGEVFDELSLGHCDGTPQHRSPKVLAEKLAETFPTVMYVTEDDDETLRVDGHQQQWQESFHGAAMRFCYKVQKLVQSAASELSDIVIVSHADAITSVLGMLKETWQVCLPVPYTAYILAEREVKILEHGTRCILTEEPFYTHPDQWKVTLHPDLKYECCAEVEKAKMHEAHEKNLASMNREKKCYATTYELDPHSHAHALKSLFKMSSTKKDTEHLLRKANSTTFCRSSRVLCRPCAENHASTLGLEDQRIEDSVDNRADTQSMPTLLEGLGTKPQNGVQALRKDWACSSISANEVPELDFNLSKWL